MMTGKGSQERREGAAGEEEGGAAERKTKRTTERKGKRKRKRKRKGKGSTGKKAVGTVNVESYIPRILLRSQPATSWSSWIS